MKNNIIIIFTILLLLLLFLYKYKYTYNESFINYPNFTSFPSAGPLKHEEYVGPYYNNIAIPTLSSSNLPVKPECCIYSPYSTSSGCICINNAK